MAACLWPALQAVFSQAADNDDTQIQHGPQCRDRNLHCTDQRHPRLDCFVASRTAAIASLTLIMLRLP